MKRRVNQKEKGSTILKTLLKWFKVAREKKLPISIKDLRLKAQQFAKAYGYENLEALVIISQTFSFCRNKRIPSLCRAIHI